MGVCWHDDDRPATPRSTVAVVVDGAIGVLGTAAWLLMLGHFIVTDTHAVDAWLWSVIGW